VLDYTERRKERREDWGQSLTLDITSSTFFFKTVSLIEFVEFVEFIEFVEFVGSKNGDEW